MNELFTESVFFGVFLSLSAYFTGILLKKKWKLAILNPLLISVILTIAALLLFHVDYNAYYAEAKYLSYLLTPATICLAIPLYEQFELLKRNALAVFSGIVSGILTSLCSILVFAIIFHFDHAVYVTFLPKSITTAIGMGVSEELGGYVPVTVAVIIITGVFGNICGSSAIIRYSLFCTSFLPPKVSYFHARTLYA